MNLAEKVLDKYRLAGLKIATAESCTGGLIGAELTAINGSSDVFERGFITYSNEAKSEMLGVSKDVLERCGAVSEDVAKLMAYGALVNSHADVSVAVTGIAGGGGGTDEKPVGLVYIAVCRIGGCPVCDKYIFDGDRETVRSQTVEKALEMLLAG